MKTRTPGELGPEPSRGFCSCPWVGVLTPHGLRSLLIHPQGWNGAGVPQGGCISNLLLSSLSGARSVLLYKEAPRQSETRTCQKPGSPGSQRASGTLLGGRRGSLCCTLQVRGENGNGWAGPGRAPALTGGMQGFYACLMQGLGRAYQVPWLWARIHIWGCMRSFQELVLALAPRPAVAF